jgi:peptide methionine sulfoxide reductase msrA/msrB
VVSYEELARLFFEIHDPTTPDRQGVDVGNQYRSAIFYSSDSQRETAEELIAQLREKGYDVVTQMQPLEEFWAAEDYHQDYIVNNNAGYRCHSRINRFGD